MSVEVRDLRTAERYKLTEPLVGSFGSASITVLNLSDNGAQLEHATPLRLATKARLWFKRGDIAVSVQGIVLWSHLSRTPNDKGKLLYRSGIRIDGAAAELHKALEALSLTGVLQRDVDSLARKVQRLSERDQAKSGQPVVRLLHVDNAVPADQALLIEHARARLRTHPEEAAKWYERARTAISETGGPQQKAMLGYREDILAVWEYLERSVELPVILRVFEQNAE